MGLPVKTSAEKKTPQKNPKIGLISLGCPKNLVDSENMLGIFKSQNYDITANSKEADVMVVNTCAFIEDSKQESIDTILETAKLKKKGKLKKLIVTGCLAQRYKDELVKEMPEVDHFVGTGDFHRVGEVLSPKTELPASKTLVGKPIYHYDYAFPRVQVLPKHTVYVKIAEGCSRTCSFCIIPKLRGPGQSRPVLSVLEEVERLVESGTKEINLIAQDLTAYGLDRDDGANLTNLLKKMVNIKGIEWIRLMYNYPMHFSDELIDLIANAPQICKYLDMPLQHIDSELLATMRRKVDETEIKNLLMKLKKNIPDLSLRTTFIVGFPGETQQQFLKLKNFIKEFEFDHMGVFTYSQEENTGAGLMKNQIESEVKKERKDILMKMQQKISKQKNKEKIGSTERVLIDHAIDQKGYSFIARTQGQALEIDGQTLIKGKGLKVGEFANVKITGASEYDLFAQVN